ADAKLGRGRGDPTQCCVFDTTGKSLRFSGIVSSAAMKNILLYRNGNQVHNPRIPGPPRDVSRSSRSVGLGCDGRGNLRRSGTVFRKELCGRRTKGRRVRRNRVVLAPRPWRYVGGSFPPATGARKAASPGRVRISRKAIARGKPGCLGCTCQNRVNSYSASAHGNAGAVGARLSLRPLSERGTTNWQIPGQIVLRERER